MYYCLVWSKAETVKNAAEKENKNKNNNQTISINFAHIHCFSLSVAELRDLHIKLLRKTRKTVHEKSWESSVSKFCFGYSLQDAWEIERFGYRNSSLKVKLRILRVSIKTGEEVCKSISFFNSKV